MADRAKTKERRDERRHALGIDCVDRLVWKEWTPGSEYTRKILVKNVDRASQTIQLSLPVNRKIFITPFPEPVTLSSGVSHEITITFRPVELVELHDALTITVEGRGSFQVRLDCLTPYARLSMPSFYDFDYCAIGVTAHAEIQLRNSGTAPVEFTWEAPAPFCILPKHAVLDQGEVMHLTLLFTPADACTLVGQAVCRLTGMDEVIATLKMSGIGKYPFICFQDPGENDGITSECGSGSSNTLSIKMVAKMNGPAATAEVRLCNPSAVPATVRLHRSDDGVFSAFHLTLDGVADDMADAGEPFVIPRGATQLVRAHYSPSGPGVLQSGVFRFDCFEGNTLELELSGTTTGPRITASVGSFDFGAVDLEHLPSAKQRTRYLTLRNTSAIDAAFAWVNTWPGAAFAVQPTDGTVPAQSTLQVALTFMPTHPILYYRRLNLLVEGATDVVVVDVFGGAYNTAARPPTLTHADIEAALLRAEHGLGLLTPAELENVAAAATTEDDNNNGSGVGFALDTTPRPGQAVHPSVDAAMLEAWRRVEEAARGGGVVVRGAKHKNRVPLSSLESIGGDVAVNTPFGLDALQLYTFTLRSSSGNATNTNRGGTSDGRAQVVTVMNTSNEPAVATWSVPGPACSYSVTPVQQMIGPHGSAVFQLQCGNSSSDGSSDDYATLCTLECYVNFESMSAFYLAPDGCVVPPHCFTVACTMASGDSDIIAGVARPVQPAMAPQISVVPQVYLPACRLGASTYQVVALHNKSAASARYEVSALTLRHVSAVVLPPDTTLVDPSAFQQEGDVDSSTFSLFPSAGVVPPRARHLLLVKFRPSEMARYEATATLSWSTREHGADAAAATGPAPTADATSLTLLGEVCLPHLEWRDACDTIAADVVFPPSCVTGEAQQQAWLRNPTALPVAFHFDTSASLLGVLRVEPEWAVVPGGERLPVTLFFSPQQPRVFSGLLQLHLEDGAADAAHRQLYRRQLRVRGEGAYAEVEVEPRVIDVGEAPDTREQQACLTLYNSGTCEVQYDVRAMRLSETPSEAAATATVVPRLHNSRGVLPARTHTTVLVAAQPAPGLTEFVLYAVTSGLATNLGEVPNAASVAEAERHPHCRWRLRAAHPVVQVVNVDLRGVARPLAWQQLSLNAINVQLAAANEPDSAAAGGCGDDDVFSFQHYVNGIVPITMDLGVAHEDAPAVSLTVTLQNTGECPAPFSLMLPTQHDANTEHWCLENTELADLQYIVDRDIITVTPAQGTIGVGDAAQLHITYTHAEVGVHRLPMLLRIGAGERRVAVVLEGRTLPPEVQVLNFHHERIYELLPVALGDMEPPLQHIIVSNPTDEAVEYSVDVAALQAHAQDNFGFPVFQCADPQGVVAAGATTSIGFYFRPLEARQYQVTVLVQTTRGEGYYVDLVGIGYHPRTTPKSTVATWVDESLMRVPAIPALIPHAGPLRLMDDVCTLGAVAYYTLCRRTCTLQLAADAPSEVYYAWQPEQLHHGDAQLAVHPSAGVLQPGEEQTVQVSFYAGSTSQVLEHLLRCVVRPSTSSSAAAAAQRDERDDSAAFTGWETSLGVLVQARVMPRDDFESLYGKERLAAAYMPALYGAHVDPATCAPASLSSNKDETRFVKTLVEELLRTVVASPSVQASFTALCPPPSATYATMRALHGAMKSGGGGAEGKASSTPAPAARGGNGAAVVLAEGILEELLRGILCERVAAV